MLPERKVDTLFTQTQIEHEECSVRLWKVRRKKMVLKYIGFEREKVKRQILEK